MDKDNKRNDEFNDFSDFNKKYEHYLTDEPEKVEKETAHEGFVEFEDISSYSDGNADFYMNPRENVSEENSIEESMVTEKKMKKKGNFFTRNRGRNAKIISLSLVIVLLLAGGGGLAWFYFYYFSDGNYGDSGLDYNDPFTEQVIYEEDHNWQAMGDVDANSLNDFLYSWANNG